MVEISKDPKIFLLHDSTTIIMRTSTFTSTGGRSSDFMGSKSFNNLSNEISRRIHNGMPKMYNVFYPRLMMECRNCECILPEVIVISYTVDSRYLELSGDRVKSSR